MKFRRLNQTKRLSPRNLFYTLSINTQKLCFFLMLLVVILIFVIVNHGCKRKKNSNDFGNFDAQT